MAHEEEEQQREQEMIYALNDEANMLYAKIIDLKETPYENSEHCESVLGGALDLEA